ncbi:MAG: nucleotidyltransferase, partial [Firmicutes bacterium]|nr:nucleotidyltransferase [Bacillota bacterium]
EETSKINANCISEASGKQFTPQTDVSMNLWGLTPDIFDVLEKGFDDFLKTADLSKDEYLIPDVICATLRGKKASVRVYENSDRWYGITYREDLASVREAIGKLILQGAYEGI